MTDDLLERATRAMRETTQAAPSAQASATRARVLDGAHKAQLSPAARWARWLVGLMATFAVSTALARVAQEIPEIRALFTPTPTVAAPATPTKPPHKRKQHPAKPASAVTTALPPVVEPTLPVEPAPALALSAAEPAAEPIIAPTSRPRRMRPAHAPTPALTPTRVLAPAPAPESAELSLFRRAQSLHIAHDPRAIDAWDDYLRVAPHGVLAPEARYNRALSLVRAGRSEQAREALQPFARGDLGGYRRAEAQALLDALDHATPAPSR